MKKVKRKTRKKAALIYLVILASLPTVALSGGAFSIKKYSINSGGLASNSSSFSLTATIAQSDAGVNPSSANYGLSGGFWASGSNDFIFINGFESI